MNDNGVVFNQNAKKVANDKGHYELMMSHYQSFKHNEENNVTMYSNLELEKERAFFYRNKVLKKLDRHLVDFDTNFSANGGQLLWAKNSDDARYMIFDILNDNKVKNVIKTNSCTLEEIGITSFLEMKKVKVIDSNVGDFICHLLNERPYHTNSSALRLATSEVADLYTAEFGIRENCNAKQLTSCTKQLLKKDMMNVEAVITGANFLVSSNGNVVMTENEGNVIKSCTFAPVHIIVAGIDKVVANLEDLNVLLPLSSLYRQKNTSSFYHIINKPLCHEGLTQKLYVILVDNGRIKVLEKKKQRVILNCIHCGACADVCPIYNTVGGHVYQDHNPGPLGSVLSPIIKGMEESSHLCSLCTSCGLCSEVCPVKIPIRDLIINNKSDLVNEDRSLVSERYFLSFLMKKFSSRKNLDKYGSFFKDFELKQYVKKKWGSKREMPSFAKQSFTEYWKNSVINK